MISPRRGASLALAVLVASGLDHAELIAQTEGPTPTSPASLVERILAGEDGPAGWTSLADALPTGQPGAGAPGQDGARRLAALLADSLDGAVAQPASEPREPVPPLDSAPAEAPGARALLSVVVDDLRSGALRLGVPATGPLVPATAIGAVLLLGALGIVRVRRTGSGRRRPKKSRARRSMRIGGRPRFEVCRDAARLEARLRARRVTS